MRVLDFFRHPLLELVKTESATFDSSTFRPFQSVGISLTSCFPAEPVSVYPTLQNYEKLILTQFSKHSPKLINPLRNSAVNPN